MLNCFARLALIEGCDDLTDLPVIVGHDITPVAREMLQRLGIGPERLIAIRPGELAQFEMLWVPTQLLCQTGAETRYFWTPHMLDFIRRSLGVGDPKPGTRRLFLSRRTARWRRVTNEADILEALRPLGFELFEADGMTLSEQIKCASEAEIIVGPGGAQMMLAVFAPRHIPIVELGFPKLRARMMRPISAWLSQAFHTVDGTSVVEGANPLNDDFSVPPEKIVSAVAPLLRRARV
jgi:capsular polysaccharide biosynthesis protein